MHESIHQLAAIMFTDIVGYTRLMGENEQKAMQVLFVTPPFMDNCQKMNTEGCEMNSDD